MTKPSPRLEQKDKGQANRQKDRADRRILHTENKNLLRNPIMKSVWSLISEKNKAIAPTKRGRMRKPLTREELLTTIKSAFQTVICLNVSNQYMVEGYKGSILRLIFKKRQLLPI